MQHRAAYVQSPEIVMEVFGRETEEILQQLRDGQIGYAECIVDLDVAFAALIPRLVDGQSRPVRSVFHANRDLVIKEINRQKRVKKAPQPALQCDGVG